MGDLSKWKNTEIDLLAGERYKDFFGWLNSHERPA